MYYLEQKQFKPSMILLGILFVPCIIGLIIANVMLLDFELLIILFIIIVIYLMIIIILWKISRNKNHYILIKDNIMELKFLDSFNGETKFELKFDDIIRFEYFRINSIRGWLMMYTLVYPKSVFLTYNLNGDEQTKHIGYLDINDVKEISKITNSDLIIY